MPKSRIKRSLLVFHFLEFALWNTARTFKMTTLFKAHLAQNIFFRLNKSLQMFEMHCAFLNNNKKKN